MRKSKGSSREESLTQKQRNVHSNRKSPKEGGDLKIYCFKLIDFRLEIKICNRDAPI